MTGKEGCEVIANVIEMMKKICIEEGNKIEDGLVVTTDYLDERRYSFVTKLFKNGIYSLAEAMKVARMSDEDFVQLDNAIKDEIEVED